MRAPGLILAAVLAALAGGAAAAESAGPTKTHERDTAQAEEITLKPVRLYSARGRRDPFVLGRYGLTGTARPETTEFSISNLELSGFIGVGGNRVALLKLRDSALTYTLRGGRLFSPVDVVVEGVQGRITPDGSVELRQGERRLVYRKPGRTYRAEGGEGGNPAARVRIGNSSP